MRVILRNGHCTADNIVYRRLEPWTQPQDIPDELWPEMPRLATFVVEPPAGYAFREGANPAGGKVTPWAMKDDVVKVEEPEEEPEPEPEPEPAPKPVPKSGANAARAASLARARAVKAAKAKAAAEA